MQLCIILKMASTLASESSIAAVTPVQMELAQVRIGQAQLMYAQSAENSGEEKFLPTSSITNLFHKVPGLWKQGVVLSMAMDTFWLAKSLFSKPAQSTYFEGRPCYYA